jgi:hypothetical protein
VARLTIDVGATPEDFSARFERAVPSVPMDRVNELVARGAHWQEMIDLVADTATHGFYIYHRLEAMPIMSLAGDDAFSIAYLVGNHVIAERMFRHEPSILLYAPLRVVIWGERGGAGFVSLDRPSDHFCSFARPEVSAVGVELDRKVAALLQALGAEPPLDLTETNAE